MKQDYYLRAELDRTRLPKKIRKERTLIMCLQYKLHSQSPWSTGPKVVPHLQRAFLQNRSLGASYSLFLETAMALKLRSQKLVMGEMERSDSTSSCYKERN